MDSHVGVEGSGNGQGGDLGGTAGGGGVLDETTRREIEQDFSKLVFTSQGRYYDILRQYADTINALENGLRRIFEERRLAGLESGLRSGPRLNVRRYVNDRAAGRHPVESRPFERKILPSEKDYAVTVLVDQSGSMGGEPIRRAFEAAVCVTEVLSRLNIEHSISGYDHSSRDYKEFSQDLDFKRLERIEWEGGGGTNEAYALRAALAMLENRKEEKKVLIVIGDGGVMPDVGIVTRSVEQKGQVRLVGLGIGPGTLNMTNYYKNCRAGMAVEELPVALTDAVREAIEDVK